MPASAGTVLRLVQRQPLPAPAPPRAVGVDDWALRKGCTYGTVVVDLERRRVLDLLPDRTAETLAGWLRNQPAIEAVARGIAATGAASVGLVFGPSTMLVFSFGVFIAPLSAAFGWTRPSIAFGSTIIALTIMLIAPLQGWLVDRYGGRRVVLTSIPLFAAGLFLMSRMGGDIRVFYLLCGLLPVLGLGLWPTSYLRVVSGWFDQRLGMAIGIANGGIGIGAALGATALPLSRLHLGSYAPGLLAYAVILGAAAACFLLLRPASLMRDSLVGQPSSAAL